MRNTATSLYADGPALRSADALRRFQPDRPTFLRGIQRGVLVVKYVLFYESADDVASKAPAHFPAHEARLGEFHSQGTLLMVGTFGNPQEEGSMAVFTTREAAEEFARGDPFVLNGVVRNWFVRDWDEVLAP
jgi:uncharacterized protein YciI